EKIKLDSHISRKSCTEISRVGTHRRARNSGAQLTHARTRQTRSTIGRNPPRRYCSNGGIEFHLVPLVPRRHPCDDPRIKARGGQIIASHKANRARPAFNVKREVRLNWRGRALYSKRDGGVVGGREATVPRQEATV